MIDEQYSESADCGIVRPTPKRLLPPAGLTLRFSGESAASVRRRATTRALRLWVYPRSMLLERKRPLLNEEPQHWMQRVVYTTIRPTILPTNHDCMALDLRHFLDLLRIENSPHHALQILDNDESS